MINGHLEEIEAVLKDPKIEELQSFGLIDEIALRNYKIRLDYQKLRKSQQILTTLFDLAEKYNLSFDTINTILFRKKTNKPLN